MGTECQTSSVKRETSGVKRQASNVKRPRGWWREIKKIKGHRYWYKRWREGGKLRSKYLGKVEEDVGVG